MAIDSSKKDKDVIGFMMQLVQERFGDDIQMSFLDEESNRLYDKFGTELVGYFKPQLSPEYSKRFDELVKNDSNQEKMLDFLVTAIPSLEEQIMDVLVKFREDYLADSARDSDDAE